MHDDFYQMYLDELKEVVPCTDREQEELLCRLQQGDPSAKSRLVEGNLHKALMWAKEYDEHGVLLTDLVQEANMALLVAADAFTGDQKGGSFEKLMEDTVRQALDDAVAEQEAADRAEEEITARVNVLQQVATVLSKELGREATVEELAAKMKMTEDEIHSAMKMAMDAVSLNGEDLEGGF